MPTETETAIAVPSTAETFASILAKSRDDQATAKFLTTEKLADGRVQLKLTQEGEEVNQEFFRAFQLAEEKGPKDREVVQMAQAIQEKWSAYPGAVENKINELVEAGSATDAVAIAEEAVGAWAGVMKAAGVKELSKLAAGSNGTSLFIQLLANYEFALERSERLGEALGLALTSRSIDPTDPENQTSAVIGLLIRTGDFETALRELAPLEDSAAPFVLYGRALAFFGLGLRENATEALQIALRYWPQVAVGIGREFKDGMSIPRPGEAVSEAQVLYGYHEIFAPAWASVPGAMEWLREEDRAFQHRGGKAAPHVGLTRTGMKADAQGNIITPQSQPVSAEEMLAKARVAGEDDFLRLLEVSKGQFVYDPKDRAKELEEKLQEILRTDMKRSERQTAIRELLKEWPGHAEAAITLARRLGQEKKYSDAVDVLEPAIFDLQKFWPDDFIETSKLEANWNGNKPIHRAYAHIVVYLDLMGETESAKAFAADYLAFNPRDNHGVRQKAIELEFKNGDAEAALKLINEAHDPLSAYNLFGRALALFMLGKKPEALAALEQAAHSRPKVYRELTMEKHRMPAKYNPSWVAYFSQEEAFNYHQLWSQYWRSTMGALNWLRKEGKKSAQAATAAKA